MVQVNEISFSDQPGDFGFGVINWLVGINAYEDGFTVVSPFLD